MAGYENGSVFEQNIFREADLPRSHTEGIDMSRLEGMTKAEKNFYVGECYYDENVSTSPGLLAGFHEISDSEGKKAFASYYERYIDDPHGLLSESPEVFDFYKERIFYGREYGLTGMDAFMNKTAPERSRETLEQKEFVSLLPRTELRDGQINNCDKPFSYGNAERMAEIMDFHKGDTGLLPFAPDRMVACRNLMALCGHRFSEGDVTKHAVDSGIITYDPLYLEGFPHAGNDVVIPRIIREMSGVETQAMNFSEMANPAEEIAGKLDQGYRGLVAYNSSIMNRTAEEAEIPVNKMMEKVFNWSANEASTLECAVRDSRTGEVKGFYICDSTANEAKRYVEADRLMKALDVKHSTILFTDRPYLDE